MQTPLPKTVAEKLRRSKVISFAIILGAIFSSAILGGNAGWRLLNINLTMLSLLAAVTVLFMYGLAFIIPKIMYGSVTESIAHKLTRHEQPADSELGLNLLADVMLSRQIIYCALIEGGIMLSMVIFLIDHRVISIVIAAIGMLLLVFGFPTTTRMHERLDDQVREVEREMGLMQ